jgi:hypothetical protein
MRNKQPAVVTGKDGRSNLKKEYRERDRDESWKSGDLEKAEAEAKQARREGADRQEKEAGLSVPVPEEKEE